MVPLTLLIVLAFLLSGALPALPAHGVGSTRATERQTAPTGGVVAAIQRPAFPSSATALAVAPSTGGLRSPPPGGVGPATAYNGTEPAPIGVADLGMVPSGGVDAYTTTSLLGTVAIDSLSAYNASIATEPSKVSFQLNAFLRFDWGGETFAYWTQDVLEVNTTSNVVNFFDNVWNATSLPLPEIGPGSVSGSGGISSFQNETYYGDGASCALPGACATLAYPATVSLQLNTSVSGSGQPQVRFLYSDGSGARSYDLVTFQFASSATDYVGFFVNSQDRSQTCSRCYGDVELVAGGPDSGFQTALNGATSVLLGLDRWNGHNFEAVPDAYDYGIATAEGLSNARDVLAANAIGEPSGLLSNAPGSLGPLWGPGSTSVIGVSVVSGHSGGDLDLNGSPVAFLAQFVELRVVPGEYNLSVVSGTTYLIGNRTVVGGEDLTLEVGAEPVVFVPQGLAASQVWSVTLNGQILNGTGNLTFGEVIGNYTFSVGGLPGYSASPGGGTVNVNATGATLSITWNSTQTSLLGEIEAILELKVGPIPLWGILLFLTVLGVIAAVLARRPPTRTRFVEAP